MDLTIVQTVDTLRPVITRWRRDGEHIALVPTMGALHDGHMALVRRAREIAGRVCVSLFVNPTQFGENEDLDTYPRDDERDIAMLREAGVDLLYAPGVEEMYPPGDSTIISVNALGDCLEGVCRPGFFTGVATVVAKLLLQSLPDYALFGEKDFQQLQIIKRMVKDLSIPVTIEGVHCIREKDGLALSSRNIYLNNEERSIAPTLYKALNDMLESLRDGNRASEASSAAQATLMKAGFSSVDYLVACDAGDLSETPSFAALNGKPGRILGAAWLGKTRLIDNIALQ